MSEAVAQITALAGELLDRPMWALSDSQLADDLDQVMAVLSRLTCVQAGLVREIDGRGIPVTQGSANTATWLRDHLRVDVRTGRQLAELGRLLDARPMLHDALATGAANPDQVTVIGRAVDALPDEVDPAVRDKAEALLIDHVARFDPKLLHTLGQRILAHVAPDLADDVLRRRLEDEEARARKSRTFTLTPGRSGRSRLSGWLDAEAAAVVAAAIDPFSKPLPSADGPDPRTPGQRRADALAEVCRLTLASGELPDRGGERPQLSITVNYDVLARQLGFGRLDTGELLSPATVRRLACDAQLIPAVFGTGGDVLDLGRTRRLYVGAARRALVLRDGGCAFPGCDRPPRWCEAHHIASWINGGATDLDNGVLLCGFHHRLIHHSEWEVRLGADRRPEFIPPAHIDPTDAPATTSTTGGTDRDRSPCHPGLGIISTATKDKNLAS